MKRTVICLLAVVCLGIGMANAQGTYIQKGSKTPVDGCVLSNDGVCLNLLTNTGTGTSAPQVQGTAATGAATVGNPVLVGGKDGSGNAQPIATDTSGNQKVVGGVATAAASVSSLGGVPIICDTASSGTVTAAQAQMVRCGTNGALLQNSGSLAVADGQGNTVNSPATMGNAVIIYTVYPELFNGATWDRAFYCANKAKLNALAAATAQIVALSGATKIRVCSAVISNNNATATTLKMVEGTGANCGTGTADVTALMNIGATSTAPISLQWGAVGAITTTTGGDALCFTSSAASSLEIEITYAQF